ncbi:uncharacterized protein L201_007213 [Kwoniella dendrophila CBS 6074]|uniref:Uncharacterized protein n=1 Tax=Kwoniella dendrophila CBS 6074 TaxID=1295534 RepID=A0AAX4K537_9TREE
MSSSTTSKGRQSLPPMSSNPFSTPNNRPSSSSSSSSTTRYNSNGNGNGNGSGNYSGGSMILSSTRIKQQPPNPINTSSIGNGSGGTGAGAGGGLSTSKSLGNLRGSSEGAGSGSPTTATTIKPPKKKNKKGMKGWAWVVEDENGNIVDAPEVEEPPKPQMIERQQPQQQQQQIPKITLVNNSINNAGGIHNINSKSDVDGIKAQHGNTPQSALTSAHNRDITVLNDNGHRAEESIPRQPTSTILHNQFEEDSVLSSPLPSRASTATAEIIPSKRSRESSSTGDITMNDHVDGGEWNILI